MELNCPHCNQHLRLNDDDRGKQARCPKCLTIFTVPATAGAESPAEPLPSETTSDQWHLRIEDGRTFGPVPKTELDQWVREGRVTTQSFLRRQGQMDWEPASLHYPELTHTKPVTSSHTASTGGNPYVAPTSQHTAASVQAHLQPHRGGMILVFGILGICCCCFFGIAAWIMGHEDMSKMKAGQMDSSGHGLTQAGYILGIIGTLLQLVGFGLGSISNVM